MPGRVKANVTWLQVGLNSSGPGMCWASSPPFTMPWRVVDPFLGQHELYDQISEADGNDWSRTEVDSLCEASLLHWTRADCNGYGVCDAGTIGQSQSADIASVIVQVSATYKKTGRTYME